ALWRQPYGPADVCRRAPAAYRCIPAGVLPARTPRNEGGPDMGFALRVKPMTVSTRTTRFRFWRWVITFIGVIVPRRFRDRFRQEWEAELEYREEMLARWDRLDWRNKLELLWRSLGAFRDALWLQQLRWEDEMIQDLRFGVRMLRKH